MTAAASAADIDHHFNGWYMYFGDHPIGESRWGVHLEGQWRRRDGLARPQQLLLRPAINYTVNKNLMLTGGYGYVESPGSREHRLWQQAMIKYKTGRLSWSTRLRFENRFLPQSRYEHRFRAWERVAVPVSRNYYVTVYDELFVYVPPYNASSAFDQNRAYGALGRHFGPNWNIEIGYMNQALLQRTGRVLDSNHTFVLSLFSRAPL
jgi:hypothetical protein